MAPEKRGSEIGAVVSPPYHIGDKTLHLGRCVKSTVELESSAHLRRNWCRTSGSDKPKSWESEDLKRRGITGN